MGIFLFTTASRLALETTQPPIQWVRGALSLVVKRPGRESDHPTPSSAEFKNAWSYNFTPLIHLQALSRVRSRHTFASLRQEGHLVALHHPTDHRIPTWIKKSQKTFKIPQPLFICSNEKARNGQYLSRIYNSKSKYYFCFRNCVITPTAELIVAATGNQILPALHGNCVQQRLNTTLNPPKPFNMSITAELRNYSLHFETLMYGIFSTTEQFSKLVCGFVSPTSILCRS
jgi:hypothetical protein